MDHTAHNLLILILELFTLVLILKDFLKIKLNPNLFLAIFLLSIFLAHISPVNLTLISEHQLHDSPNSHLCCLFPNTISVAIFNFVPNSPAFEKPFVFPRSFFNQVALRIYNNKSPPFS